MQIFLGVTDCFGTFICPPFRQLIHIALCMGWFVPINMTKWAPSITHILLSFSGCWVTLRHSTVAYFSSFFCAWSCLKIGMMSLNTKWSILRCWVTDSQPWSRVGQRQELLFWRRVTHSLFGGPSSHLCFLQSGNLCGEDQLNVQLVPSSWPSLVPSSLGHYTSSIRFFLGDELNEK